MQCEYEVQYLNSSYCITQHVYDFNTESSGVTATDLTQINNDGSRPKGNDVYVG